MEKENYFISRHSQRPKTSEDKKSENFEGITEEGERKSRERTIELSREIEEMEDGSVLFYGGVSRALRTRSTMEVYTDELKKIFENRDDVLFVSRNDIEEMSKGKGYTKTVGEIIERINKNPEAKVIIEFPLWIKQFSAQQWWDKKAQDWGKYMKDVLRQHPEHMMEQWLTDRGRINQEQVGPDPDEVAKKQLDGLKRIYNFAHRLLPDRPIVVGVVGHSLELDALLIYLANEGKVDINGYQKIGGEFIQENEMAKIERLPDGKMKLEYRNQEFIFEEQQKHSYGG